MHIVLLNSGGKDSLATAHQLRNNGAAFVPEIISGTAEPVYVHSVYIDIGWRNRELAMSASQFIADEYCDTHDIVKIEGSWQKPLGTGFPGMFGITGMYNQNVTVHVLGGMYATKNDWNMVVSGLSLPEIHQAEFMMLPDILKALYKVGQPWDNPEKQPNFLFPMYQANSDTLLQIWANSPLFPLTVACNEATACGVCAKCRLRAGIVKTIAGAAP